MSLLVKPAIFPEIYAVIANVYPPATGAELDPPLTERRLEDAEYIELKIASKELGLFFNSVFKTVVLRLNKPPFSVLTPKLDKYTPFSPKPDKDVEVREFNLFLTPLITGSSDNSPASFDEEPLNVLVFNNVLASFTAVIKD